MKLKNEQVKISEILLDPYNPRFFTQSDLNQDDLARKILSSRLAKELLSSMKRGIKWVNLIVVKPIENFSPEQKRNIKDIGEAKYIVVEGNTRLACLKKGEINSVDDDYIIPVIITQKEDTESFKTYESEIRILQGIANVMVVKEWESIVKARHLFQMFNDKELGNYSKVQEIYKEIADELGMNNREVRENVIRYTLYNEISKQTDTLSEGRWGYLEAFDQNGKVRSFIGMDDQTNKFIWDSDDYNELEDQRLEFFIEIPNIITSAINDGLNTKEFRDIIKKIIEDNEDNFSNFFDRIKEITDSSEPSTWRQIKNQYDTQSEEEKWEK